MKKLARLAKLSGGNFPPIPPFTFFFFSPLAALGIRRTAAGMIKTFPFSTGVCGGLELLLVAVVVVVGRNNEILLTQYERDNTV